MENGARDQGWRLRKAKRTAFAVLLTIGKKSTFFLGTAAFLAVIKDDLHMIQLVTSDEKSWSNPIGRRVLSIGDGGECKWQPPVYDVPDDIDFYKTIIAGYPSGGKRLTYIQMEALTGWPAKDEWEFEYVGMSNHPFIKSNYPHHDGIWGWGNVGDQVVLMVRNIRSSMIEFHDIMWDHGYETTWQEVIKNKDNLYMSHVPLADFEKWRDWRLIDEIHWYGWFIDYWMEGGLLRDMFTNKITTKEHWDMLTDPDNHSPRELEYNNFIGDQVVTPTYDSHCINGDISGGCEPVAVISSDKLMDYTDGPAETTKIAETLMNNPEISQFLKNREAWNCIWDQVIVQRKGGRTVVDRPSFAEDGYTFQPHMLQEMISELDRLITKYGSDEWNGKTTANRLVGLLTEHRGLIQTELDEVNSGIRKLPRGDLGPKVRRKERRQEYAQE